MILSNYFRKLRNYITGTNTILNVMNTRFDILQAKMDSQVNAMNSLESPIESLNTTTINTMQVRFDHPGSVSSQDALLTHLTLPTCSIRTIANSLNLLFSELPTSKKFAFLVHDPLMLVTVDPFVKTEICLV